jgi:hypothetical protein
MPDLDLIKQAEQRVRDRRKRLAKGGAGNPADRCGCAAPAWVLSTDKRGFAADSL